MRDDLDRLLAKEMENPKFKKEWDSLEQEFGAIQTELASPKKTVRKTVAITRTPAVTRTVTTNKLSSSVRRK